MTLFEVTAKPRICFICGEEKFTLFCKKMDGFYYKCERCGLIISSFAEQSDERHERRANLLSRHPFKHFSSMKRSEYSFHRQTVYKNELCSLEAYRKLNSLLDIGCGVGGFLLAARDKQWKGIGTEVSSACIQAARQKGLEVYLGNVTEAAMEPGSFDVIRMHNVIEHLKDPQGFLKEANKLLRPGGLLLLSTLNMDSFTVSFQKENWKHLIPHYHVHLFNTSNLRLLLNKTGFTVKRLRTRGFRSNNRHYLTAYVLYHVLNVPAKVLRKGHRMYLEIEKTAHPMS